MLVVTFFFATYLGLAFLAPVFYRLGRIGVGDAIYNIYSTLCHQRSERSMWLFGKSPSYSLSELEKIGVVTIEERRAFRGNEEFGYKVAICYRDIAIYSGLVLAGLFFYFKKSSSSPATLQILILGTAPMVLDGGTQLIAEIMHETGLDLFGIIPTTEIPYYVSTNIKRVVTGGIFAMSVGAWLFPSIENEFEE